MDMRTLQTFLVLAEALHFGRAAERCHLSPSALSRLLQRLEAELGVSLCDRDSHRVALTPAGMQFQAYARDAVQRWQACRQSLQDAAGCLQGEIRLFCSVTASYHFLARLLPRFRVDCPNVDIHLHTGDQAESVRRVLAGTEDLAIAARTGQWPERLAFLPLARTPLVFVASRDSTLAGGSAAMPDWPQLPLVVAERGLSRECLEDWFRRQGWRPRIYAQVAGHEAIVSMVSLGYGIGVVPQLVLENSPLSEQVQVVMASPALPMLEIGLCCQQRQMDNTLLRAFWDAAERAFG